MEEWRQAHRLAFKELAAAVGTLGDALVKGTDRDAIHKPASSSAKH